MQLLDLATPSLRDVARDAGVSYFAIRQYRRGQRTPSPDVLRRLAKALRHRGDGLARAAALFEAAPREQTRTPNRGRQT